MSENKNKTSVLKTLAYALFKNNPLLVQLLGVCSALAVTTNVTNAIGMGVATTAVLICSSICISLLRNFIPKEIKTAAYIIIISGFTTAVKLFMQAFTLPLYESLEIFIPLIAVNCIIIGRAEEFASKNNVFASAFDALATGAGYTLALALLGSVREILGRGTFFGHSLFGEGFEPVTMIAQAPGAFIILGCLMALFSFISNRKQNKEADK